VLTREEADNTLPLRSMLETYAMKLFMERAAPELISEIENSVKQSEIDLENNDFAAFEKNDYTIHEIIQNNCGNPWIPHFLEQIRYVIALLRKTEEKEDSVKFAKKSIAEHKKILRAMKKKDVEKTVEYLQEHLEHQRERLDRIFRQVPPL
jgi:DNA-binding GntR family transcriptional regulator